MNFLNRLFGRADEPEDQPSTATRRSMPDPVRTGVRSVGQSPDEQAIERYRYLLRTAPPATIEEAHAEAFAQLTPE